MAIFNMSGGGGKGYDGPYFLAAKGPCPDGYHIPSKDEWNDVGSIIKTTFSLSANYGTLGTYLKMPAAGGIGRNNGEFYSNGSYCNYRSSSVLEGNTGYAYLLTSNFGSIAPTNTSSRGSGCCIRCFKNSPVIPNSSWTTLYNGNSIASGAGIFWNSTLGLISISGDGNTWYTLQDKNLGATTVYNSGTPTDANSGYFYQWGNNYGFPHSGSITKTKTKVSVDQTTWNDYSSSIFIYGSPDWNKSATINDKWGPGTEGYVIVDGTNYYS